MKKKAMRRRRKCLSFILTAVMLASVFGECSAVLAATSGVGDGDQLQQEAVTETADPATEPAMDPAVESEGDESAVNEEDQQEPVTPDMEATMSVKASNKGRTVTLKWDPVSGAATYDVTYSYVDNQSSGQTYDNNTLATGLTETTVKTTKPQPVYFNEYTYTVTAKDASGNPVAYGQAAITPKMSTPPKAKGFKVVSGYNKVTVRWKTIKKPSDDSSIIIWYRIYKNGKLYKKVKEGDKKYLDKGKKTMSFVQKMKEGDTNKYRIRTVYRKNLGVYKNWKDKDTGDPVSGAYQLVLGKKQTTIKRGPVRPIEYRFTISGYAPYYTSYKGMGVGGHLSSGTKYTATGAINTRYIIKVNGKTRWLPTKYTKNRSADYVNGNKDYYTKEEKEDYVNARKISSRTSYMIWVSAYSQRVNLFKKSGGKWKLKGNYLCSTGGLNTPTPTGQLRIWSRLMHRHGLRYWNNFYSLTALHQSPAKTMGYPSSRGGCVRLKNDVARYIYYNIPMDTRVLVY